VGISRIIVDAHYATDTLAGITVGALSGWLLPELLHYGFGGRPRDTSAVLKYVPVPTASSSSLGLSWSAVL
jgi:membrane-associated phospholipid phosphatase